MKVKLPAPLNPREILATGNVKLGGGGCIGCEEVKGEDRSGVVAVRRMRSTIITSNSSESQPGDFRTRICFRYVSDYEEFNIVGPWARSSLHNLFVGSVWASTIINFII